jgi:uncharacterized protein YhaN
MKMLDIRVTADDLLQLFDRLSQDSEVDGYVKVDNLVDSMASLSGNAKASGVFDLKHLMLAMRRDLGEQAEGVRHEVAQRHQESQALAATAWQVTEVRQEVASLQDTVASVAKEVGVIGEQLQKVSHLGDKLAWIKGMDEKLAQVLDATERLEELERRSAIQRKEERDASEKAIACVQGRIDALARAASATTVSLDGSEVAFSSAAVGLKAGSPAEEEASQVSTKEGDPLPMGAAAAAEVDSTTESAVAPPGGCLQELPESQVSGPSGGAAGPKESASSSAAAEQPESTEGDDAEDAVPVESDGKALELDIESTSGQVSEPEKTPIKEPEDPPFTDLGVDELCKKMLKSDGGNSPSGV